jgi:hypothetical protein
MSTYMSALSAPQINYAEFVRLTLPSATFTFCNAADAITVDGIEFEGLSGLIGISEVKRNIKANSADLQVSINGIDPNNIAIILGSEIKGSKIELWRGFLDENNQIIQTPTQQFFKRYQGIINTVTIDEEFSWQAKQRIATCNLSSCSMRYVLENRVAGLLTNKQSWISLYPTDTSMDRVSLIASTYFDFGKAPVGGSQSQATILPAAPVKTAPFFNG